MKIHEGCGGLVRWVEAVKRPGVGYTGHCLHCDTEGIVVERIIPVKRAKVEAGVFLDNYDFKALRKLEWKDEDSFEENQERLKNEIESALEINTNTSTETDTT